MDSIYYPLVLSNIFTTFIKELAMVAIQIFGHDRSERFEVESNIFSLLKDQEWIEQMVLVTHDSTSRNIQKIDKPFLIISAVPGVVSIVKSIQKLRKAGYKVQVLHFSPASESAPRKKKKKKKLLPIKRI